MKTRLVMQFIADWNNFSSKRDFMLSGDLSEDHDENYGAVIAAVIHALCDRDGYSVPECLEHRKAETDILISLDRADSEYGQRICEEAVDACWQRRVFFTPDTLDRR